MQLPSIDRIQNLRPLAAELASLATGSVVPVAPVNPSVQSNPVAEPSPSVVNLINRADKPSYGEGVYSSVSDPGRRGSEAATAEKDWTIKRPAPEKVQDLPPEPLFKMLIDHIQSLWQASASAVQVQTQIKNQTDTTPIDVNAPRGVVSAEVFTYSPSKIAKAEKPKS